jgi:hypothetical protein
MLALDYPVAALRAPLPCLHRNKRIVISFERSESCQIECSECFLSAEPAPTVWDAWRQWQYERSWDDGDQLSGWPV